MDDLKFNRPRVLLEVEPSNAKPEEPEHSGHEPLKTQGGLEE
jgi:hypothetical protein